VTTGLVKSSWEKDAVIEIVRWQCGYKIRKSRPSQPAQLTRYTYRNLYSAEDMVRRNGTVDWLSEKSCRIRDGIVIPVEVSAALHEVARLATLIESQEYEGEPHSLVLKRMTDSSVSTRSQQFMDAALIVTRWMGEEFAWMPKPELSTTTTS